MPFPESSLNEEAGKLFMEDYDKYFKIASIFSQVHAGGKDNTNKNNNSSGNVGLSIGAGNISNQNFDDNYFNKGEVNSNHNSNFNSNSNYNPNSQTEGFITPTNLPNNNIYQTDSQFNYNLLRHSRSVCVKPSHFGKPNDNRFSVYRRDSNAEINSEIKTCQKPSISSLPFIVRSNSFAFNNANGENQNCLNFLQINNSGLGNLSHFGNGVNNGTNAGLTLNANLMNHTPRSKKEEIKKWLSRI